MREDQPLSLRVLIVDDDRSVRDLVQAMITVGSDHQVVESADNAETAVAAAVRHQPDVIITDLAMGGPPNQGSSYVARLKEAVPAARIVVFSGSTPSDTSPLPAGAEMHLVKPADLETLVAAIEGG